MYAFALPKSRPLDVSNHTQKVLFLQNFPPTVCNIAPLKVMRCILVLRNVTIAVCCVIRISICIATNIVIENSVHFLVIRKFSKIESFYDVGSSKFCELFKCLLISTESSFIPLSEVYKKCYLMHLLQRNHDHTEN